MPSLDHFWTAALVDLNLLIAVQLAGAALLGAAIGYERSFHGRAAGMRTYALVCMASAGLVALTSAPGLLFGGSSTAEHGDPTRVVQGIVTGVGFLGAGMILREGLTIRGLSTAASIWVTAAVGVLAGAGLFLAALAMGVLCVVLMSGMRWLESRLPQQRLTHCSLRFAHDSALPEETLVRMAASYGFTVVGTSYARSDAGHTCEYQLTLRSYGRERQGEFAHELFANPHVREFRLSRLKD